MLSVSVLVLLLPLVKSSDVAIGLNSYGTKIFDEDRQASPAIWRQTENVTIVASDNEVISKVLVIDMRPDKDGDAKIVDGGEKQKNVTIELKSPTVFRGYDFHIEVYAVPEAHSSKTDQNTGDSSEDTSIMINDKSSSVSDVISEQSTLEPALTDTLKDTRNLNMDNSNESNETEIKNVTIDSGNKSINEPTSLSDHTKSSDVTSTAFPETTFKNVPDFPLTGMEGDEKRHSRKIGDDLYTSTDIILTTIIQIDSTTESYSSDNNTTDTTSGNMSGENNTGLDLGMKGEIDSTTVSDIIMTTTLTDESVTISPDKNGKDIPDFDDLLSTDGEESRFSRQISAEIVSTTNGEISTTEDGPTTTISPEIFDDFNNETRKHRQAVYGSTSDTTKTSNKPQINMEEGKMPPILKIIIENGAYDMNVITNKPNGDESDPIESSGDINTADSVGDNTTIFPDVASATISSTESNENSTEEQFRNVRGISEENDTFNPDTTEANTPNYPVLVDPLKKPNVDDDYVYVPILAVISKHHYPVFRGVLDNISMNVAFPDLDTNAAMVTQVSDEIQDAKSKPIVSLT